MTTATTTPATTSTQPAQASVAERSSLLEPLSLQDIVDIACFSREALTCLPDEERLRQNCIDERELPLLIEGGRILRVLALDDDKVQPDADEIQALLLRFVQIESILGVASSVSKSCIGEAQADKKKCQEDCKKSNKKFCGCFWNSFLAKADCFVNVNIGVGGGG